MKKTLFLIVLVLFLLGGSGTAIYYDSTVFSPTDFKVTFLKEESPRIPDNFDNVSVLFFSDLCYGDYFNKEMLEELQNNICMLDCDLILFGGDLFDKDYSPISDDVDLLSQFLSSLPARLGKFAIMGDYDLSSETRQALVNRILKEGNFELLQNSLSIYNQSLSSQIILYGFSYGEEIVFSETNDLYTLAMVHGCDNFAQVGDQADFAFSGHAHQWQLNTPFIKSDYSLGQNGHFYLCSSVGMSDEALRLFNDPELLYFTLKTTE